MTPNSSIHILAKSAENIPANLQTGGNDWVDVKERPIADQADTVTQDGKAAAQADKVQHEVAALKMAQGLLKGVLSLEYSVAFTTFLPEPEVVYISRSATMQHQVGSGWAEGSLCVLFGQLASRHKTG